jgi:hypothetical protein
MPKVKNGEALVEDIISSLNSLGGWGSLEIFVQNHKVTQITKRAIEKTNHTLDSSEPSVSINK